jgi:N-ethylmaleimide reductase
VRLSTYNTFGDVDEGTDGAEFYGHLAAQLDALGLAYLHVYAFGRDDVPARIRDAWQGRPPLVVRDGRGPGDLLRDLGTGLADIVPVGKLVLADPDLITRRRAGGPFNAPVPALSCAIPVDGGQLTWH